MATTNKTDANWEKLFDKYKIDQEVNKNGFFEITATQINEFREARLMTKFDHKSNLPELFKKNKLSILPKTRGSYIIGQFDAYKDIKYTKPPIKKLSLPAHIKSIDPNNIYSEATALSSALCAGMIDDIVGEQVLPTVFGRMSTSAFQFDIRCAGSQSFSIDIKNAQCEIDGGYESLNKFAIVEAKNFTSSDFLIRQVYFPYRLWKNKLPNKDIMPIFMTYSNDVYSFFIYKFQNDNEYNSLQLVEQRDYMIGTDVITANDVWQLLNSVTIVKEPEVPFPQCNSFERIIDLLGLLYENELAKDYITSNYDFDPRQTDYYTNGGKYLGLIEKDTGEDGIYFTITQRARDIMSLPHKEKSLDLVKCMLEHEVFNKCIRLYFSKVQSKSIQQQILFKDFNVQEEQNLSKSEVVDIMKKCYLYNVDSLSTVERRASTVLKWCNWIIGLIE